MKQITIRSIPDEVKKTVQKEAERKGMSLNKAIISLLERAVGTKAPEKKKKVLYHDLDHLAGLWSREEAAEFDKTLKAQRGRRARRFPRTTYGSPRLQCSTASN